PAADEGYVPRGFRANTWATVPAATRAVDLLLARVGGRPWESELVVPTYERVTPAPPLVAARATIGLATEGGLVPPGNPDRLEAVRATRWARYELGGRDSLANSGYQSAHGGYDARWVHEDPNRLVPLDAARALE